MEPLELNKQTFEKEVIKAAKRNPGAILLKSMEIWRQLYLQKINATVHPPHGLFDVLHLWTLATSYLRGMVSVDINQIVADAGFTNRLEAWYEEARALCAIMERIRKKDLGQLVHFIREDH